MCASGLVHDALVCMMHRCTCAHMDSAHLSSFMRTYILQHKCLPSVKVHVEHRLHGVFGHSLKGRASPYRHHHAKIAIAFGHSLKGRASPYRHHHAKIAIVFK